MEWIKIFNNYMFCLSVYAYFKVRGMVMFTGRSGIINSSF